MWPTEFTDVLLNPYKIIKHDSKNQHKSCNFDMSKNKANSCIKSCYYPFRIYVYW